MAPFGPLLDLLPLPTLLMIAGHDGVQGAHRELKRKDLAGTSECGIRTLVDPSRPLALDLERVRVTDLVLSV